VSRPVSICCYNRESRVSRACRRRLELLVIWPGRATLDAQGLIVGASAGIPVCLIRRASRVVAEASITGEPSF
jgi:hypothetical protein